MSLPGFFTFDREAVYAALFARATNAYDWKNQPARRVKLWTGVPPDERPAFFQFEGGKEEWTWKNSGNPNVLLEATWFIYTSCPDPEIGATILNQVLNSLTNCLLPDQADITTGKQTLGGLVQYVRISGSVTRVPGDIDGDGMAMVPIKMLMGPTN